MSAEPTVEERRLSHAHVLTFECFPATGAEADLVEDAVCAALDSLGVKYHYKFDFKGERASRTERNPHR